MSSVHTTVAENLAGIRERIAAAARRSGRPADAVRLVAVTKYVGPAEIEALLQAGCRDLGESRPQALWDKAERFAGRDIRWHMIGHLQRNKVRRTLPLTSVIHSGDSLRLLAALNESAGQLDLRPRVFLEVNISGDTEKHGLAPEELPSLLPRIAEFRHLDIQGLMAMAAREGDLGVARANFSALRQLRDRLQEDCPAGLTLEELSMGMSGDFEVAIQEGATVVRVGSALFEGLAS